MLKVFLLKKTYEKICLYVPEILYSFLKNINIYILKL